MNEIKFSVLVSTSRARTDSANCLPGTQASRPLFCLCGEGAECKCRQDPAVAGSPLAGAEETCGYLVNYPTQATQET